MFSVLKMTGVVPQLFWGFLFGCLVDFFIYLEVGQAFGNKVRFVKE